MYSRDDIIFRNQRRTFASFHFSFPMVNSFSCPMINKLVSSCISVLPSLIVLLYC